MMPSAPAPASSLAIWRTRSSSTSPSIVQPKAVASPQLIRGRLGPPCSRHSATTRRKSSIDSSVPRRTFERLCPSLTDSTKFISWTPRARPRSAPRRLGISAERSEEHTSELQSHLNLVCRLLLEKKKHYAARECTHVPAALQPQNSKQFVPISRCG